MNKENEQLLQSALRLPPVERAQLVENLLCSFEFPARHKTDQLWADECEDRLAAYKRGELASVSAEDVFAEIE